MIKIVEIKGKMLYNCNNRGDMRMNICKKIIINIILVFILICTFTQNAFAKSVPATSDGGGGGGGSSTMSGIVSDAESFLSNGTSQGSPVNDEALKAGSSVLYNVLLAIGVAVAVIWGIIIGIEFVTGTLEDKADLKKALVPYVFGCVIIFGAFGIWKLVINLLQPLAQ